MYWLSSVVMSTPLIQIKDYIYLVPYIENETSIFLKTIILIKENGEWQSHGNIDEHMKELQSYVKKV